MFIQDVEQLSVRVRVLLTRVWVGRVHVRCNPVGHHVAISTVFGPFGDWVAQILADDPFEGVNLTRFIETSQEVVEGSVFEQDKHDMIHRVFSGLGQSGLPPLSSARKRAKATYKVDGTSTGCDVVAPDGRPPRPMSTSTLQSVALADWDWAIRCRPAWEDPGAPGQRRTLGLMYLTSRRRPLEFAIV